MKLFSFLFFALFAFTVSNFDVTQTASLKSKATWESVPNVFRYRLQYQRVGTTNWSYAYASATATSFEKAHDTLGTYRVGIRYQNCALCAYSTLQLDTVAVTY